MQAPLYADDPSYAALPDLYLMRRLARDPVWAHAERALFVARRGRRAVGRIAAIANHLHNGTWHDRVCFFGLFEYASRAGLGLYGVAAAGAVSFAVGIHLGWFLPITVIGLWTLARANLSLGDLRGRAESA